MTQDEVRQASHWIKVIRRVDEMTTELGKFSGVSFELSAVVRDDSDESGDMVGRVPVTREDFHGLLGRLRSRAEQELSALGVDPA